ncbi:phosphatase PAP2 family protein [Microbacterium hominis]|uniref:Phosphatase PAP2 family protein n=1 Tax=Microbacterium hominis TaxID=162426 RepID=A0A7D4U617_9MICO|nr:phosphatase PAP2 family protein [Microbacterium hominis]QKJ20605.1 phosphatase PAP2 family protein [Microbacterium hominis]
MADQGGALTVPGEEMTEMDAAPAARRPRALLWWALGLTAAFAAMGMIVALDAEAPFTQATDDAWRLIVGASPESTMYLAPFAMFYQFIGGPGSLLLVAGLPLVLAVIGRWRSALFVVAATMTSMGLYSQGMKNLVDRPRPAADEALGLFGPLFEVDHGSYPSGHAVAAAAFAFTIAAVIRPGVLRRVWWVIGGVLMLGMMWQRTLINAHWLSDTFFGLIAGAGAVLLIWWAFWPWLQKDYGRPVWFLHLGDRTKTEAAVAA